MTHSIEELAAWLDAKADAVRIPDPGAGGIVEDRIGTAAWMAPALQEAARYRAAAMALREMSEALKLFAEAAKSAAIAGRPPFEFVDASDYERAAAVAGAGEDQSGSKAVDQSDTAAAPATP